MVFVSEFKSTCLYTIYIKATFKAIDFAFVNCPHHVVTVLIVYKAADLTLTFIVRGMLKGLHQITLVG